jgi:ribosomal protein S18 acetylase RimI-like enzyme
VRLRVRALNLDALDDVATGAALVEEYVAFTAEEADALGHHDVDLPTLRRILPDLRDFAGRYRTGAYLVAEQDGATAGGVGIARVDDGTCEMNRLWLREPFRGGGNGRALVTHCLDHARALGFTRMVLDVAPYRTGAIELYRSFGFEPTDPIHEYPFEMVPLARAL